MADIQEKIFDYGVKGAVILGGIYFVNKFLKDANAKAAEKDLDNSPEAQQADHLFSLLRPSNNVLFDTFTPIDQPAIVAYAKGITNFNKVSEYYSNLSKGQSLPEDLRTILSAAQRDAFFANLPAAAAAKLATTIIANARDAKGTTVKNGSIYAFGEPEMKTHPFTFTNGTKVGDALKKVTAQIIDPKTKKVTSTTTLYYVRGTVGASKDKTFYVLASQVIAQPTK